MLGLAYERPRPWRDRATLDPTYVATGGVSACQSRRRRATSSTEARSRIERISLSVRRDPSTSTIRSCALASTSPRSIGLSAVPRSVTQHDFDDRLAPRQRMHEFLARDQLDPSLEREDRRIAHSPMIVNG